MTAGASEGMGGRSLYGSHARARRGASWRRESGRFSGGGWLHRGFRHSGVASVWGFWKRHNNINRKGQRSWNGYG